MELLFKVLMVVTI